MIRRNRWPCRHGSTHREAGTYPAGRGHITVSSSHLGDPSDRIHVSSCRFRHPQNSKKWADCPQYRLLHEHCRLALSAASTAWAWGVRADVAAKLVLLALADMADDGGRAACTRKQLRDKTGMSAERVGTTLDRLAEKALVLPTDHGFLLAIPAGKRSVPDETRAPAEHKTGLTKAQTQAIERAERQGLKETLALIVEHGGGKAREGTAAYAKLARDFLKSRADYTVPEIHAALKLKLAADYIKREHKTPSSLLRPSTLPEWVERADQQKDDQAKIDSSPDLVRRQIIESIGGPGLDRLGFITAALTSSSEFARQKGAEAERWFKAQGIDVQVRDGRAMIVGRLP